MSLADFHGKKVILYFYPKDETSGCTKEACAFRDGYSRYTNAGLVVLGCSVDSADAHKDFIRKNGLPFPLLLDPDKKIATAYGAANGIPILGLDRRITYVIDENGKIIKVYPERRSVHPCDRNPERPGRRRTPPPRTASQPGGSDRELIEVHCTSRGEYPRLTASITAAAASVSAFDSRRIISASRSICAATFSASSMPSAIPPASNIASINGFAVVVRLGESLAHGAPPELARLDSIEIDRRRDALAKNREQRSIARVRREILVDALRLDEIIHLAVDAINAERTRCRLEHNEFSPPAA